MCMFSRHFCLVLLLLWPFLNLRELQAQQSELADPPTSIERQTFGYVEKIRIFPGNLIVHAKLDTGADTCSLGATNVRKFKRKGERWVRFDIRNRDGELGEIESRIVRTAKIKRINGLSQERLVVRLDLCLGGHHMEVDVNLENRSNFSYRMLIGRNFLAGHAVVDPALTYLSEPSCAVQKDVS